MITPRALLKRRTFLAMSTLPALPLAGCGGGDILSAALPGTTGTGILALASITGFGSVIVGGQTYDETSSTIAIDGIAATRADLRLGMTAKVNGTWYPDTSTGVAQTIAVYRTASGTVTAVNNNSLVLHGQTFGWDSSTLWDGVTETSLQIGQPVIVWALQANNQATQWLLTRIAAGDGGLPTITGLLERRNNLWWVGDIQLLQMDAFKLSAGQLVWVRGQPVTDGTGAWVVSAARVASLSLEEQANASLLQMEGMVTTGQGNGMVRVGDQTLDASTLPAAPTQGQRVQVTVQRLPDGRLRINDISGSAASSSSQPAIKLSGRIENWHSAADFTIQGQRCNATNATGDVQALMANAWVSVTGTRNGAVVNVQTVAAASGQR